jgi:hypothetical protein
MKISQQSNMYTSTIFSPSRSIAIGRNIYLESIVNMLGKPQTQCGCAHFEMKAVVKLKNMNKSR